MHRGKLCYSDGEVFIGEWAWGKQLENAGQLIAANETIKKNLIAANGNFQKKMLSASYVIKKNMSEMVLGVESDSD